ncbi:MAG: DUF6702 family protein [Flavobacteriaceae bacterium]
MKFLKVLSFVLVFPLLVAASAHKFYVSTTQVEYVAPKQSLQIISKIFIDDIEDVLQERYNPSLSLDTQKETKQVEEYLKKYVLQKLTIKADGKEIPLTYVGREYDNDIVKIFLEGQHVTDFSSITIENKLLFELTTQQQNIVHVKKEGERKSLVLDVDNPNGMLNFDE